MYVTDIARPVPIPGQVLVKIRAFGLNRMDILQREGLYPLPSYAPETMGVEFSGVIEQLGDEATAMESGFKCGDEVFGLAYGGTYISHGTGASGFCHWAKSGWGFVRNQQHNQKAYSGRTGAYAEYIVVSTKTLFHKPAQLSWEEAAGIPETWMTATQALLLIGEFQSGQSVLWHAGASSVSIAGIQLAQARGASAIYATAGSPEKIHFLEQELGVTKAFNYKTDKWAAELQKLTTGVNLVVDFIGAPYFQNNLDIAARDGRIILLGLMGGANLPEGVNIAPLLYKRLRLEASGLRSRDLEYQKTLRDMLVDYALPKFCDRSFKVHIEKVFQFEDIVEAHQLLEKNQTKGKIIYIRRSSELAISSHIDIRTWETTVSDILSMDRPQRSSLSSETHTLGALALYSRRKTEQPSIRTRVIQVSTSGFSVIVSLSHIYWIRYSRCNVFLLTIVTEVVSSYQFTLEASNGKCKTYSRHYQPALESGVNHTTL
ncbi:unnamed protein product [Aspergillus oryzae]|nr:unnamed protein product [Aspergillus oryzae]